MKKNYLRQITSFTLALALVVCLRHPSFGYSVLTHEAIIDSTWTDSIKPLLLKRFPAATAEQLREARAHTYGGAIIQDMGYYPLGSQLFTDLVHYVRSGDFIATLIKESKDLNEYAFALGALAHHAADNEGHSIATNHAVPILYPKLRAKFGNEVTYDESPSAHLKTEFGFDVLQVAKGRYAPENYHDFIGFKVSKSVLERAFQATYGLEMKDFFTDLDLAIGTYRYTAGSLIPQMTKVAWETKEDEIEKLVPGITREQFLYSFSRPGHDQEWGQKYDKPVFLSKAMAFFLQVVPKVGPFEALAFKTATPETEQMFQASFIATLSHYRTLLRQVPSRRLNLPNNNFDLGRPTRAGEYDPADDAYAKLLTKLASRNFRQVTPELRQNLLAFYGDLNAPIATKNDKRDWQKTVLAIEQLKAADLHSTNQRVKN